jgi:glycine cleavage system transcriptional repressor
MNSYLVISALGKDKPGLIDGLSRQILDSGCNVEDSRMTVLGGHFAVLMLVSGNWNNVAKLETQLAKLEDELSMTLTARRTERPATAEKLLPYGVEVVSMDHPGIVHNLARFFSSRNINVQDLVTSSYRAAHTGTQMFSVHMTVGVPAETHIATLREEFMDFCDQLNLDAVIEPVKA